MDTATENKYKIMFDEIFTIAISSAIENRLKFSKEQPHDFVFIDKFKFSISFEQLQTPSDDYLSQFHQERKFLVKFLTASVVDSNANIPTLIDFNIKYFDLEHLDELFKLLNISSSEFDLVSRLYFNAINKELNNNNLTLFFADDFEQSISNYILPSREEEKDFVKISLNSNEEYFKKFDFKSIVAKGEVVDVSSFSKIDMLVFAHISEYINTFEEGLFLSKLMNSNINSKLFIGKIGFILFKMFRKCDLDKNYTMPRGIKYLFKEGLEIASKDALDYSPLSKKEAQSIVEFPINQEVFFDSTVKYIQ